MVYNLKNYFVYLGELLPVKGKSVHLERAYTWKELFPEYEEVFCIGNSVHLERVYIKKELFLIHGGISTCINNNGNLERVYI
jgi:hypothetical protein